jgi:hypothetical protein
MPDGTVMTEEAWEEFNKRYGQRVDTPAVPEKRVISKTTLFDT